MKRGENNNRTLNRRLFEEDADVMREIFEAFWEPLFFKAFNILKNEDDAKDAVQNVLIDLWKRRKEKLILNLNAYLLNAVKYQVFKRNDKITKNHIERFEEILSFDYLDELIRSNELNEHLNKAVEELPEKCREVFKLSRFDNLSNKEISEKLDVSIKTVENHITKALRNLRTLLKEII